MKLSGFLGEHLLKLDSKFRLQMPMAFVKQNNFENDFVLNRDIEKCLSLRTRTDFELITEAISHLNYFRPNERKFVRLFLRGATPIQIDKSRRFVIPRRLLEYADIDKEILVVGLKHKIELWNPKSYDEYLDVSAQEYSSICFDVLGGKNIFDVKAQHKTDL